MIRIDWRHVSLFIGWSCALACGGAEISGSDDAGADVGSDTSTGDGSGGVAGAAGTDAATDAGPESGGTSADSGSDADAGSDAAACQSSYALGYCVVLDDPPKTTTLIVPAYLGKVNADCRVAKAFKDPPFLFANELTAYTLRLWGCNDESASSFGLAQSPSALSAADAAVLIDYYVELSVAALSLGPKQEATLRAALECLAATAITNPSTTEHELSSCAPDGGLDAGTESGAVDGASDASSADVESNDGGTDS